MVSTVPGSYYGGDGSGGGGHRRRRNSQGMPLDPQGRIDLRQLAAQRLNFLDQYNSQLADINRNFRVQLRQQKQNEPFVQRGILGDYSGHGMAFGTGYASAAGREAQLFGQKLNDLRYQHTLGQQDLAQQQTAFNRTYGLQQQAIRQAAADRLATQAGALNLYNSNKPLTAKQIAKLLGGGTTP